MIKNPVFKVGDTVVYIGTSYEGLVRPGKIVRIIPDAREWPYEVAWPDEERLDNGAEGGVLVCAYDELHPADDEP